MKKSERASIVRVLIDLIKADSVIDEGEPPPYATFQHDYNNSRDAEISPSSTPLSDAVMTLVDSSSELRNSLMEVFSDMTVSDGFCAAQEAQLMLALIYCLKDEYHGMSEMYSVHEPDVFIEANQVMYV